MVAAIGSGIGNVSLAREGHGTSNGHQQHASGHSGHNRPVGDSDRAEGPTSSGDDSQAAAEREAFDTALRSVALTILNSAMASSQDALAETEEDA
ncbi:nodulation protein NopC [Mesorhizobium tamadayense]|uniref:Nodulation protein NopC n=1 Tax=Mesorhizobium tamadayense TaxID=425306 RepID=A0A3P3F3M2_9HYPH|nr:nodulation protein NopC [Mesorhizobium tamadayense]